MRNLEEIKNKALVEIEKASDLLDLEKIWRKYLGRKKGEITKILRNIRNLPEKERPLVGKKANEVKEIVKSAIDKKKIKLISQKEIKFEKIDITRPGKKIKYGHFHPLTLIKNQVRDIFYSMGFEILEGPEIETDYYNFEALNMPEGHPARDFWDTFYLKEKTFKKTKLLLRTHTSPMQIRVMEKKKPPLRVCVIGKCFRHEATDASHEHTLYQIEGFAVDENISVANLIYTLKSFLSNLFNQKVEIRLRPSYFPFVEPGFELDVRCLNCLGKGCPVCSYTGWVETLGCGMIHPKVFEAVDYPKDKYTGFAFGIGLDRLAMMKYKINDIRWFHSGDLRFIRQF